MSVCYADRVCEETSTTGTGTVTLNGAKAGFQSFVAGVGDGARVAYVITDGGNWETGIGTVTDAGSDTLSRDIVLGSSNGGSLVSFPVGTKDVQIPPLAHSRITTDKPYGLLTRNDSRDTAHDIRIDPGHVRDNDDELDIVLKTSLRKRIDASWAVGDGNGGLFSGAVGADTWYHFFLIFSDEGQTVDAGWDTDIECGNIPAGYTAFARIASHLSDSSSNITGYTQLPGGWFLWDDPPEDVDVSNLGATATLYTLSVPPDVAVMARLNVLFFHSSAAPNLFYMSTPAQNDEAPGNEVPPNTTIFQDSTGSRSSNGGFDIITNTSSQVRARAESSNSDLSIATLGWQDFLGPTPRAVDESSSSSSSSSSST